MGGWKRKLRFDLSLWAAVTAMAVLAVMTTVAALWHFEQQKQQAVEIFLEKGSTLIRSFEAALRDAGDENNRFFSMQKLLIAISQQPDIDYLIVTDDRGNIIADSDPSMVSQKYGLDLDTQRIARSREIRWRQTANAQGAGTFEVYRGFFPLDLERLGKPGPRERFVVYLGFNMDKIEKASAEDTRNTVLLLLALLLVGSLAVVSLFLVQSYRLTRVHLSRVKIFSETLIKNMPIGLVAVNAEGKVTRCNDRAREILKTVRGAAAGEKDSEGLPPALNAMLAGLPEKGGLLEREIDVARPDGSVGKLEALAAGFDDGGAASGKILLFRDVTQIRRLEEEVARSRHLRSLSSLAAGVAHEIRNPLSSLKGFAVYLKERLPSDGEDRKTAEVMVAEVERLNRVITQLIEFARPLELRKERVRLSDLIAYTLALTQTEARAKNLEVIFHPADDEQPIEADADNIKQVFLNVFLNAMAAMKKGGRMEISLAREKKNIAVSVADDGEGIPEEDWPRIYDPYFTSKPAGTGLGLAVVQTIMEAHGGRVDVKSAAGRGTTVFLRFPLPVP